jgi:hypothetical protein
MIERYNTSSVVCWVAALFMLLSFSFAWLRSPRSGRVVFALGIFAVVITQGIIYVVWEKYNLDLYVLPASKLNPKLVCMFHVLCAARSFFDPQLPI